MEQAASAASQNRATTRGASFALSIEDLLAPTGPWHFETMTDDPQDVPLGADFPAASREDWLKLVQSALKDRPYERLIAKTYDGLVIEPLYPRASNARPVIARNGIWQVMQRVDHPDPAVAHDEALHDLENGATGLTLVFKGANRRIPVSASSASRGDH